MRRDGKVRGSDELLFDTRMRMSCWVECEC